MDCKNCKHNYKPRSCEPKCSRMCENYSDYEPITNVDRIRQMTNEELAQFLVNFKNTFGEEYEGEMSCLEWLRKEVEEKDE